jgi:hypothetical protein
MEVTRIADLPPKLMKWAENRMEFGLVNSFTKILDPFPKGSGRDAAGDRRPVSYF